jgi:hypothetical protein
MTYDDFTINGLNLPWLIKADWTNLEQGQITLHCLARKADTGVDPRVALETLKNLACSSITNTKLLNGGSLVRTSGGSKVEIIENGVIWVGAIHYPRFTEESYAAQIIEFELVLEVELPSKGGSFVYTGDIGYDNYVNIETYPWYNNETGEKSGEEVEGTAPGLAHTEIGWMKITEPQDVIRVEVYGSTCVKPGWIDCNGVKRDWNFEHDHVTNPTFQKLTWDLVTPTDEIILHTSDHYYPSTDALNHGCWLLWIRVVYK